VATFGHSFVFQQNFRELRERIGDVDRFGKLGLLSALQLTREMREMSDDDEDKVRHDETLTHLCCVGLPHFVHFLLAAVLHTVDVNTHVPTLTPERSPFPNRPFPRATDLRVDCLRCRR